MFNHLVAENIASTVTGFTCLERLDGVKLRHHGRCKYKSFLLLMVPYLLRIND